MRRQDKGYIVERIFKAVILAAAIASSPAIAAPTGLVFYTHNAVGGTMEFYGFTCPNTDQEYIVKSTSDSSNPLYGCWKFNNADSRYIDVRWANGSERTFDANDLKIAPDFQAYLNTHSGK